MSPVHLRNTVVAGLLTLGALFIAGCGDDDEETKAAILSVVTTDSGKRFKMTAPKSVEAGLVTLKFSNASKAPHEAQIVRVDGHTPDDVVEIVSEEEAVLPDWLKAEGGVATTPPGRSGTATVKLSAGRYAIVDTEGSDEGPAPSTLGAKATFEVTGEGDGEIEETSAKIVAKDDGKERHAFEFSGLKAGRNNLTFDNASEEIHHVIAFPVLGNATAADVKKFFEAQGQSGGPPPVDFEKGSSTAVIDGKRKTTTGFSLQRGRSVLVCFLTDRDGKGKSHVAEGMLEEIDIR